MKAIKQSLVALLGGAALIAASSAQAVPVEFFGEDLNPGATVPAGGNAQTARNNFLSNLVSGIGVESFEGVAAGTTNPSLSFPGSSGSITASLNGLGGVCSTSSGTVGSIGCNGFGRFPTSGSQWYHTQTTGFDITFSSGVSAFGFYGVDIGDFNGQLTATASNGASYNFTIPHTAPAPNGSLLFWGFIDTDTSYTSLSFSNTGSSSDVFGFDDLVIGDLGQISVPAPATLALLGLGLLGLGAARRKSAA